MNQMSKAYDDTTSPSSPQLRTTVVGTASAASTAGTDRKREAYWILSQVYDQATNTVRVVTV